MNAPRRRGLRPGVLLRGAVSLGLLAWLLSRVGWRDLAAVLGGASLPLLGAYVLLGVAATVVSAAKWSALSRPVGLPAGIGRLILWYFVGYFFSNFLPTSMGGDVVRAYEQGRPGARYGEAMAAVFVERYTGFVTLLLCVVAALVWRPAYLADVRLAVALAAAAAGFLAVTWAALDRRTVAWLDARLHLKPLRGLLRHAAALQDALHRYRQHRPALAAAFGWSVAFYAITLAIVATGCLALGVHPDLAELAAAVPLMLLLFAIPLSIGGIGLQEWAYFFVLTKVGIPPAVALGLGVLFRLRTLAFGAFGGLVYPLIGSGDPRTIDHSPTTART